MSGDAATGTPRSALVVGCGLIGTSIALALRAEGWTVRLADIDPANSATAAALGAGTADVWPPDVAPAAGTVTDHDSDPVEVAVVAVPPAAVPPTVATLARMGQARTVMHVASVQVQPRVEIENLLSDTTTIVGTHPMAGSERGGPAAAAPGLFRDRPWVICPGSARADAVADAHAVVITCGARAVHMDAAEHDAAVALVSHVPQLVSSAMAALLTGASAAAVGVAGSGVRDVTRLADGDPELWSQIVSANAAAVRPVLRDLQERLGRLEAVLETPEAGPEVAELMAAGHEGRRRLGGKHGGRRRTWASVQVVIPDEPGALVAVLSACRDCGINLEDLRVEHSAGAPNGLLELLVEPGAADDLATALRPRWDVVGVVRPHD